MEDPSMSVSITRGTSHKPVSSEKLVNLLSQQPDLSGQLFIAYPIIRSPEGGRPIDALWISADKGIVIFDLIEGTDTSDYGLRQDDTANKLEAKLRTHSELMDRRKLRIPIHAISFAPGVPDLTSHLEGDYPLANATSLLQALEAFTWGEDGEAYKRALSAIESISTIRQSRTRRTVKRKDSRGAKLKRLEDAIATLDQTQSKAVIETVEGVQRIRGLAGSGKTIVLALKAAYLHALHPDWRIAVTFNTRSLKGMFHRLIEKFYFAQMEEEPNWENLRILNAWGAPGGVERDGIYHEFCRVHDVKYFDFRSARRQVVRGSEFTRVCEHALRQARKREVRQVYDAILVDEAQDFSPAFLRLCYQLLKNDKRLVYAYDELQNLSEESLPSPDEIFGKNAGGSPYVRFDDRSRRDIILQKCYRNSRPVLVTAHALGFGIYRDPSPTSETGLVQMFDHPQLWEEIGYSQKNGELKEGNFVTLYRREAGSPKFLEDHSDIGDLVQFLPFDSAAEQAEYLTTAIKKNLMEDELRPNDIIVINPDPLTTRDQVGPIRRRLLDLGINSHIAGVDTDPDVFFFSSIPSVTFTGVHRAKGNEAGMVYIINAQDCHSGARNLASIRNRLFTAITRSKAWIRVLGIGNGMAELTKEYETLKARNFELQFTYPTAKQREQLRIVHRDMTEEERKRLASRQKSLADLVRDLESGTIRAEDLDELDRLRELLMKKG